MRNLFTLVLIFLPLFFIKAVAQDSDIHSEGAPIKVSMAVPYALLETFNKKTEETSCVDLPFEQLSVEPSRGLSEIVIVCKALAAAGMKHTLNMIPSSGYKRSLRMATLGEVSMSAETIWHDDINTEQFYVSHAILREGEHIKGVYTLQNHPLQRAKFSRELLAQYNGVTKKNWQFDWLKLKELTPMVTNASSYRAIYRMLVAKRADFTLLAFGPTDSMEKMSVGITLYPIKNIRVSLPGSRHFTVSKLAENATRIHQALNKGIVAMREKGQIKLAYEKTGLFNANVKDWPVF